MRNWKSLLNDDATDWLLEESNPSVRYFALRWLLDQSDSNKDVVETRQVIAQSAPIWKIVERQRPEGYWGSDTRPDHGTRGPLMVLLTPTVPSFASLRINSRDFWASLVGVVEGGFISRGASGVVGVVWRYVQCALEC